MTQSPSLAIILAAGKGTRMKSAVPKVLHKLAGAPMIAHVLGAAQAAGIGKTALVVGPGMEDVAQAASALEPKLQVYVQPEQQGTADAVKAARQAFEDFAGHVLILYGDTPLLRPETLKAVGAELAAGADLVVIGFEAENPTGYGRLLLDDRGRLVAIREEKDASDEERALTLCNSGIMGFRSSKDAARSARPHRQEQRQGRVLSDRRRRARRWRQARGEDRAGRAARRCSASIRAPSLPRPRPPCSSACARASWPTARR